MFSIFPLVLTWIRGQSVKDVSVSFDCSYQPSKPTSKLKVTIPLQRHVCILCLSLRMYRQSGFWCTFPVVDAHKVST